MRNRAVGIGIIFVLFLTLFGGCKSADESTKIESKPVQASFKPTVTAGKLRVLATSAQKDGTSRLREMADKFMFDYPDVDIEIEESSDDTAQALAVKLKSGEAYDLVEIDDKTLFPLVREELLSDITPEVKQWSEYFMLSAPAKKVMFIASPNEYKTAYFIPHSIRQDALLLRKDLFGEMKTHEMNTVPKMLEYGRKLQEKGVVEYPLAFYGGDRSHRFADMFMLSRVEFSNLVNIYNAYYTADRDGSSIFAMDRAKQGLEDYRTFYQEMAEEGSYRRSEAEAIDDFVSGKSAMILANPQTIRACEKRLSDEQLELIYFPLLEGEKNYKFGNIQGASFGGWAKAENAANPDTALAFLLYISNSDNNTKFAKDIAAMPVHSDALEKDTYFSSSLMYAYHKMIKRTFAYYFVTVPVNYTGLEAFTSIADAKISDFLAGEEEAEDVLAEFDAYWKKQYAQEGPKWMPKKDVSKKTESK